MPRFILFPAVIFLLSGFAARLQAQVPEVYYKQVVANVSPDSIYKNLQALENLGIKELNTQALENTRFWLMQEYENMGYTASLDTFEYWGDTLYNIIVDKKGTGDSNIWLIVCSHYDTKAGPGVNDNGSGVAVVMETARLLKDIETYYSVRFIHFSAEEPGYKGSLDYVNNELGSDSIRLVFNIDEVGAVRSMINTTITCERDEGGHPDNDFLSFYYTNVLDTMMRRFGGLNTKFAAAFLSDYTPFELKHYVITGLYESNVSPFRHTIYDSLSRLDTGYLYKVTRGAVAATLRFAGVNDKGVGTGKLPVQEPFKVYPNPASDILYIEPEKQEKENHTIVIADAAGRQIMQQKLQKGVPLQVSQLSPGVYFFTVRSADSEPVHYGRFVKR